MTAILYNVILICVHILTVHHVSNTGYSFYNNRIQKGKINPKVYDIGVKYTPNLSNYKSLEYLSHFFAYILPLLFGIDVFREYLQYYIVITLLRYLLNILTILPKEKHCDDKISIFNYIFGHCYDKIFSGHFASLFLLSLILFDNKIITSIPLLTIFNVFNALLILSLRFHYTIDIIVAILVTIIVYQNNIKIPI